MEIELYLHDLVLLLSCAFAFPFADSHFPKSNVRNVTVDAVATGVKLFRLTPPPPPPPSTSKLKLQAVSTGVGLSPLPSSSVWMRVNYTRVERLLHCAIPHPDGFEREFSSLCWHNTLDLGAAPGIYTLRKKIVAANMTREESRSIVASIEARSNARRLVCLPNIFIPGFPKSGSTSLFNTLVTHPLIENTEMKETHYFTRFLFQNDDDIDHLSVFTYLRNFDRLGNCSEENHKCLSIDASQSLLWDTRTGAFLDELPLLIKRTFPGAKFIVIMREPVQRFHSDFWFFAVTCMGKSHKYRKRTGPAMFHERVTEEIAKIQDWVQKGNEEEICIHHSLLDAPSVFDKHCGEIRLGVGAYYVHIARWLRTFPIQSFHFVRKEDLMNKPYAVMKGVWKFLDVPPIEEENFKADIQPSYSSSYPKLLPETQKALTDFYRPYNEMLSNLLKDDRYLWQDDAS